MEEITTLEAWERLLAESGTTAFVVFKHSTRCPISAAALQRAKAYLAGRAAGGPPFYLVLVIESRPVSNAIAETLAVAHKSPQAILVKGGQALWSASHYGITEENLRDAVATA